jgi:predicted phosphoribosyltransferase
MVPDESLRFADRAEAGSALAVEISRYLRENGVTDRPLVLGMSRGGVPVAAEVARSLDADLDVIVVGAIGLPWKPDFKVGAVAENGSMVINHDKLTRAEVSANDLAPAVTAERAELTRLGDLYRDGSPAIDVADRTVIVVDDGMQTGVRARAALRALHAGMPAHLMFATPVCAAEATGALEVEADGLVHVRCPCCFSATGLWYRDIPELTDADITGILRRERTLTTAG